LTPAERAAAPALHAALLAGRAVAEKAAGSAGNAAGDVISAVNAALSPAIWRVQYIAFVNAETLQPITVLNTTGTALLAIAAYLGTTRLIDNEVF
jgi:pantoate--beta-alanine ligase